METSIHVWTRRTVLGTCTVALLAGCAAPEYEGAPRKETLHVLTKRMDLLTINTGQPRKIRQSVAVTGLAPGDTLIGIDYRVAKGVLYAVSLKGGVYTLDATTGVLKAVSSKPLDRPLEGTALGVDFNPVADRIRVVSHTGFNIRLHPDTGALAATDPMLAYAPGDAQAAFKPELVAAAYTYNKKDDKLTTNYAIDIANGWLLTQGSREGVQPVVSPNTGVLAVVGELGTGALEDAAFDIADTNNAALAALRSSGRTRLFAVDLDTGRATLLGTVGDGRALWGLAIAP